MLIAAAICAFVFFFQGVFKHLDATVFFADALSVGLFALAGASKAVSCDVGFVYAVLLGAITGVGGGAIRDVCVGEVPGVFKESNFYAVASLGGALMYVVAVYVGSPSLAASLLCVFTVVALRYWSVYFDWRTSTPTDLTPVLSRTVKAIFLHGSSKRGNRRFRGIFHMKRTGPEGEGGAATGDRASGGGAATRRPTTWRSAAVCAKRTWRLSASSRATSAHDASRLTPCPLPSSCICALRGRAGRCALRCARTARIGRA